MSEPPRQLPSSSKAICSISAIPTPSVSPPWTWPSTIIGLIRTPQSSTATNRRTVTAAVPRHRDLLDRDALLGVALARPPAARPLEVVRRGLEHRRRHAPRELADLE